MEDRKLFEIWDKFIDRDIYRVTSDEYLSDIILNGLNPTNDPFREKYTDINKLFELMTNFEKRGVIYQEIWRDGPVPATHMIGFNRDSRINNYLDFVADDQQLLKFCKRWKGGCLTGMVFNFTTFLQNQELSHSEKTLVDGLHNWTSKKREYRNRVIAVNGSNFIFESAKMLCLPVDDEQYIVSSPYGSFEHFKKTVNSELDLYLPFIKLEKLSYLRVTEKIPSKAIRLID